MAKNVLKSVKGKVTEDVTKWVQPEVKRGGFSDGLWNSRECQEYVTSSLVCGYFGNSYRTIARDKVVEAALRAAGLGDDGAACWLTSTSARHMMDNVDRHTKLNEFANIVGSGVKDAFVEVAIWSHPDFGGSYESRRDMIEKLRKALATY
jgi:hypothetical protein